nr:hypothetical protein [Sandaracinus amylolyticus]
MRTRSAEASSSGASNSTFPLASTVFTCSNPARSNARELSGIEAFIGATPRRSAA